MGGSLGGINDPNTRIMGLPRSLSTGQLLEGSHEGLVSPAQAFERLILLQRMEVGWSSHAVASCGYVQAFTSPAELAVEQA